MWGGYYYGSTAIDLPQAYPGIPATTTDEPAHRAHAKRDPHLRSLASVTGYNIEATDGGIGHIESFLVDDESWDIRYLVGDTRNWWFGRHVLLSPTSVHEFRWDEHKVILNLTCYKIKSSPPWEATRFLDRTYEALLQAHYNWPASAPTVEHAVLAPLPAVAPEHERALS
jgi:hypothetical protein